MLLSTSIAACYLRPWAQADMPHLARHANNRDVWRNLTGPFPHPYTEANAHEWITIACKPGRDIHLAIEFEGHAVGGIGASAGAGVACRTCQFGYWLGQAHWGKGVATAAARSLVGHIEDQRLFVRLEAPVLEWNPASMRVLEKVGFIREGVLRKSVTKDNQLIDSVMYAYVVAGAV